MGEGALKIILLGDSAVGKSKLVERFLVRVAAARARSDAQKINQVQRVAVPAVGRVSTADAVYLCADTLPPQRKH